MNEIDQDAYLAYAKSFTEAERGLIDEFERWLPSALIDCHAHCNLAEHVRFVDEKARRHMLSTFPSFSLDESEEWHRRLHPGKSIRALRFPKTFRGIDHKSANAYLLGESPGEDRIALYGLPDDVEYTIKMLEHPRVSALKMYHSYLEPTATEIYQYFPKAVLAVAQERGIPIILHPPRAVTECLDQIVKLFDDFPCLRVCMAHIGLTKSVRPGLEKALATIAAHPLVCFDTALVPSAEVVSLAMSVAGSDRVMYGSDQPLHLIRSAAYHHPRLGERIVTEFPYHWVDRDEQREYGHLAVGVTHAHWQALRAIKDAVTKLPLKDQEKVKQQLFHDNAESFYGF
ncbi:MAG: hypothetical protein RL681_176 [Candidatus Parcubacteria bacterium]